MSRALSVSVQLRVTPDMHAELERRARATGVPFSTLVRMILTAWLADAADAEEVSRA